MDNAPPDAPSPTRTQAQARVHERQWTDALLCGLGMICVTVLALAHAIDGNVAMAAIGPLAVRATALMQRRYRARQASKPPGTLPIGSGKS